MLEPDDPVKNLLDDDHLEMLSVLPPWEVTLVTQMLQEADQLSFPNEPQAPMRLQMVKRILQISASRGGKRSDQIVQGLRAGREKRDPDAVVDAPIQTNRDDEKNTQPTATGFFDGLKLKGD